MTIGKSGHIPR